MSGLDDSIHTNNTQIQIDATPITPSQSLDTHFIAPHEQDVEEHQQESPVNTSAPPSIFTAPFKYFTRNNTKHERTSSLDAIISSSQREQQQHHDQQEQESPTQSTPPIVPQTIPSDKIASPRLTHHQRLESSDFAYNSDNIILTTSNYNSNSINNLVRKFFAPSNTSSPALSTTPTTTTPATTTPANPSPSLGRRISNALKRITISPPSTTPALAPSNTTTSSQPISSLIQSLGQNQQPQGQQPSPAAALEEISLDASAMQETNPKISKEHPHRHKIPRSYKSLFKETIHKRLYIAAIIGNVVMGFVFLFLTIFFAVFEQARLWYLLIVFAILLIGHCIAAFIFSVMLVRNVWREKRRRRKKMIKEKIVEEIIIENRIPSAMTPTAVSASHPIFPSTAMK